MIQGKQTTVYDWFDIQNELCKIMDIPEDKFRDYHEIDGGDYKDFWHVCLDTIVPDHMSNGTTVTMFSVNENFYRGADDQWKNKVLVAWNKLYNEILGPNNTDSGIEVSFDW